MTEDPEPPPVINSETFAPRLQRASELDLSATDGKTIASLALLAAGAAAFLFWNSLAPIAGCAGVVLSMFSKPSQFRTIAFIGNVILLGLSLVWMVYVFFSIASDPLLRDLGL
jgi:hypothetical protein